MKSRLKKIAGTLFCALKGYFGATFYGAAALSLIFSLQTGIRAIILQAFASEQVDVWWPANGSAVSGVQPFKSLVSGRPVEQYVMSWSVDSGQENMMWNSYADYPHKEASVDVSGWSWRGTGPYNITFKARDFAGNILGNETRNIYAGNQSATLSSVSSATTLQGTASTSYASQSATTGTVAGPGPLKSQFSCGQIGTNSFFGCYYNDRSLSDLVLTRIDPAVNFDWGGGSPDRKVNSDNFSAVWQGNFDFTGGTYNFSVTADDGVRVYIDKSLVLDEWADQPPTNYSISKALSAGQHLLRIEYYENAGGAMAKVAWTPVVSPVSIAPQTISGTNPFSGARLWVNPYSAPKLQADDWRTSRPADAALLDKIANQPESVWLGDWNDNISRDTNSFVSNITESGAMPVLAIYNIPRRDCGQYSAGGVQTPSDYRNWVRGVASGIAGRRVAVIVEPDGLALIDCLSSQEQQTRFSLIRDAVSILKGAGAAVYIDAGHPGWINPAEMAGRLLLSGIASADGFALNVSNFMTDTQNEQYGAQISALTSGKHFLIDTSRNGRGSDGQWCNPWGRALGNAPTVSTGNPLVDARLWVKGPGGSDGYCNGGPAAGVFWPDAALDLARNAHW